MDLCWFVLIVLIMVFVAYLIFWKDKKTQDRIKKAWYIFPKFNRIILAYSSICIIVFDLVKCCSNLILPIKILNDTFIQILGFGLLVPVVCKFLEILHTIKESEEENHPIK